jgi:hypothetical protein
VAEENCIMSSITIELRRVRLAGHVAWMWAKRSECRLLVGKPEGKNH